MGIFESALARCTSLASIHIMCVYVCRYNADTMYMSNLYMYQKSFDRPPTDRMWYTIVCQFVSCLAWQKSPVKLTSPFALRAHFAARSFHVSNIALSRNKHELFPLNCIKIAFWPTTNIHTTSWLSVTGRGEQPRWWTIYMFTGKKNLIFPLGQF